MLCTNTFKKEAQSNQKYDDGARKSQGASKLCSYLQYGLIKYHRTHLKGGRRSKTVMSGAMWKRRIRDIVI